MMHREPNTAFVEWAERKWHAYGNGAVTGLALVHVSDACLAQARAAYPPNADVEFGVCFKVGAMYYDELRAKYHAGQVRHELAPPMNGAWYILLYQDHLYVDDREHPVPTRVRKRRENGV
jgi:hypothetical protein